MNVIKSYLAFLVSFLVIDFIWIAVFAAKFYQRHLSGLLSTTPDYSLVAIFYLCYAAGVLYLIIKPAKNHWHSAFSGGVFGALTYGTFTITNYTIFDAWSMAIVLTDILWGAFITGLCALVGFHWYKK